MLREILREARARQVPAHAGPLHYLGGLLLIFVLLEAATGVLLMVYYRPSAEEAHRSVAIINDEVRLGWLIRALHHWGANLVILLATLHVIRVYFSRAYQTPRQLLWTGGVLLLLLLVALGFSGTLLPWDQYAYWYIDSARAHVFDVPIVGNFLLAFFWGGWELGSEVLLRFYVLHVGVIPWLGAALVLVHFVGVWRLGIREPVTPVAGAARAPRPFFPDFVVNAAIAALLIGGVLLTLAIVFPPPLLPQADPLTALAAPPPWYLLPLRAVFVQLPGSLAALAILGFIALLLLAPVLDRRPALPPWKQALQRGLGLLVIALWWWMGVRALIE